MKGKIRLLGSVPNSVAHNAPCSVLIVDTVGLDFSVFSDLLDRPPPRTIRGVANLRLRPPAPGGRGGGPWQGPFEDLAAEDFTFALDYEEGMTWAAYLDLLDAPAAEPGPPPRTGCRPRSWWLTWTDRWSAASPRASPAERLAPARGRPHRVHGGAQGSAGRATPPRPSARPWSWRGRWGLATSSSAATRGTWGRRPSSSPCGGAYGFPPLEGRGAHRVERYWIR